MKVADPERPKSAADIIEQWTRITASVAGMLTPVAIALVGWWLTSEQENNNRLVRDATAKQEQEGRIASTLLQAAPMLLDSDVRRVRYATVLLERLPSTRETLQVLLAVLTTEASAGQTVTATLREEVANRGTAEDLNNIALSNTPAASIANNILQGSWYVGIYTATGEEDASRASARLLERLGKIGAQYTIVRYPANNANFIGLAVGPAMNLTEAKELQNRIAAERIVSGTLLISAARIDPRRN